PKDDLKHRALWRESYSASEQDALRALVGRCGERKLQFIYGLSPGLDIRYGDSADVDQLRKRFEQMQALGCEHFALLFDDIPALPDTLIAAAQSRAANTLQRDGYNLLFCPTVYCGRMAERNHAAKEYLITL